MTQSLISVELNQAALAQGFCLAGSVDIDRVDLASEMSKYDAWIGKNYQGEMQYLVRGRDRRADPRLLMPEAKSILCVAFAYSRSGPTPEPGRAKYARYLEGPDYHDDLKVRLQNAMSAVNELRSGRGDRQIKFKICVDTSAVLERFWAQQAGLGWIGKNSLLINPQWGSYLFLAEVLMDIETGNGPAPIANYCGNCTRCLEACPVGAFDGPGVLNSNQCLSYMTLEKRGEISLDHPMRQVDSSWIAGCDICQEVCPFNIKPSKTYVASAALGATSVADWKSLLSETEEQYRERVKNSALKRVKYEQFQRNLAIVLAGQMSRFDQSERDEVIRALRAKVEQSPSEALRSEWRGTLEDLSVIAAFKRPSGETPSF